MAVEGRTHKPVVDRDLCQSCSVCLRECPAELFPELRPDEDTTRGYVYSNTDLAAREVFPPCFAACPLGQQVRDYVRLLEVGNVKEALLVIRQDNPLPGVCGYICHHPCEEACIRGSWDDPVSIRELKRYAAQYEMDHRGLIMETLIQRKEPARGKKVVIVGAGPAGLACGFESVMRGYEVTIMDALAQPGGMLAGGIPSFRLPRSVVDHDVGIIRSLGVRFLPSVRIGQDVSLRQVMKDDADAVVLATGAWIDLTLDVPGEGAKGYLNCLDFLDAVNSAQNVKLSGRVLVVGGGNAAIDTARSALRLGAEQVIVVYRRSREEMPANHEEVEAAIKEGVEVQYLLAPKRILTENGGVTGLELVRIELADFDEAGRRRPVLIEGSEYIEEADVIITALGQRPGVSFLDVKAISEHGTITRNASGMVPGYEGLFAAGDAVSGPSTVVEAMASGKLVAQQVMDYLEGMPRR
ncbi:MAG: FAD-dependent oxidoreductase [Deltaproteobacteria bacterium]|nr:FAD-dependent oxidoreductase [Deltaproteobacteria bacterium]